MRLQVLAVTMHREDLSIAEQMNIRCDALVTNQADREDAVTRETDHGVWRMITTATRGVGRNRNIGLEAADGDLLLLSDDDVVYRDDMPEQVSKAFADCPRADVIIFGMDMVRGGQVFETRSEPFRRVRIWNALKYGTYRIALRGEALKRTGIRFHESFGGGCPFSAGEDSLFIKSCLDNRLRVYAHPYVLGTCCKDRSSWFVGYNDKYFYDKGVLVRHLFPRTAYVMALYFAVRFKRETDVGVWRRIRLVYAGLRGGKQLTPYPNEL